MTLKYFLYASIFGLAVSAGQSFADQAENKQSKRKPMQAKFAKGDKNEHLNDVKVKNICPENRWKQLSYTNVEGVDVLVDNQQLFELTPVKTETAGRHKGQPSVSLLTFVGAGKPNVNITFCDERSITFTTQQIKDQDLKLVMNQKMGLKLIDNQQGKQKAAKKYIYSIKPSQSMTADNP